MKLFKKVKVTNHSAPVTLLNGKTIEMSANDIVEDGKCLVCDSDFYHFHVGCYLKWKPENRNNFKGWKEMNEKDAIKHGLSTCPYCFDEIERR